MFPLVFGDQDCPPRILIEASPREPSMGNTCASVHIALTDTTPDAIEGIVRAYTTLGFERAKTASPEGGKHVILLRKEGDAFLSVYDSDNAALDTGELKDLALATSKICKTAAVCTSLYDSDTFEVVVFNAGKQVDLVMTHLEQYSNGAATSCGWSHRTCGSVERCSSRWTGRPSRPWRRSPKPTMRSRLRSEKVTGWTISSSPCWQSYRLKA